MPYTIPVSNYSVAVDLNLFYVLLATNVWVVVGATAPQSVQ